ncbi:MAG: dockerin type I repeat-containing protein [Ruminococcus flavefaciens]|nr:dockerin type I repeat-containing protein [Ruminococcus flavefaciens]
MKKILKKITVAVMLAVLSAVSITGMAVNADVMGDVNADGRFNIADVTLFQSWLMGKDVTLNNCQSADFCEDGILDVFDLCMMKKEFLNGSDEFKPCTSTINDVFVDYVVVVTTKKQYPKRIWTAEDFKGVENIDTVLDATPPTYDNQILYILLKDCSKENVLKMIHDIENANIEEICTVRPTSWESDTSMGGIN